jgi:hypothetical protein
MEYHTRCDDESCHYRCRRPGCQEPGLHFLARSHYENGRYIGLHAYACMATVSVARMAVESLRPGMAPDEVAIARRVVLEALTKLEQAERDGKKWTPEVMEESA